MNLVIRFPDNKRKALTFSYDDGCKADEKLIKILDKNGLKGTFNLNSGNFTGKEPDAKEYPRVLENEVAKRYINHEIAVHTKSHPLLSQLPSTGITSEIYEDRKALEKLSGKIVRGMAYPFFAPKTDIAEACMQACGIVYSRTTNATKGFEIPDNWYYWNPTCHHAEPRLMELADNFVNDDNTFGRGLLFYVWGHSFEFEKHDNWNIIEDFAKKVANKNDIWYATNIEIYEYIEAYRSLVFNLENNMVYNPSAKEVFFMLNRKNHSVKPGETVKL